MLTSPDQRKISYILQKLGLTESEIAVFFLGLRVGAVTIKQLADETKMNRITVHEIVRRLIKKGLFLQTYSKKKRLVYPNQVDALENLLDSKKLELDQMGKDIHQATAILRSIQAQSERFPKTRFYKGKEGIHIMISEIIKDKSDTYIMSDGQHFYDLIDNDFLEKSLQIRQTSGLTIQMLFPSGFEYFCYTQGTYQQKLEIKALPEESLLKGGCTIRGEKIAFHCYEGLYITTTIIENKQIAQIMLFLYQSLWKFALPY